MKLYAPKYYKNFKCIADKCRHSCCKGWEIDIDEETLKKYTDLVGGYGNVIKESIENNGTCRFKLDGDERCPHLDCVGLCNIIKEYGEEYLSAICREHPRYYNPTARGLEVGIGMACEEACRIILSTDEYSDSVEIEDEKTEIYSEDFDVVPHREKVYSILSNYALPYVQRLELLYQTYGVSPSVLTDEEWRELLDSLEYLDEKNKDLFLKYTSDIYTPEEFEKPLERALAYFVYRHCSKAYDGQNFSEWLGFCLFCERLLASLFKSRKQCNTYDVINLARILSEEIEYSEENTDALKSEFW